MQQSGVASQLSGWSSSSVPRAKCIFIKPT